MARNRRRSDCPVHTALNVLGDRWTLVIVRDLLFTRRTTFTELLNSGERIATNTLADRLAKLEHLGIVEQEPDDACYWLTEKGLDLAPILVELVAWSVRYEDDVDVPSKMLRSYQNDPAGYVNEIKAAARARRNAHDANDKA